MSKLKKMLVMLLALLTVSSVALPAHADQSVVDASAAIAVDAESGQVLYQQNANKKLAIASLSKLLTVLVIKDEIANKELSWNTKVKINKAVASVANNAEYSNAGLKQGQSYTIKTLVELALVKSADGATLALAGAAGDSTASFNKKMQKKAKEIGVTDATIVNSVGLQNGDLPSSMKLKGVSDSAENKMTAKDVAKIASYLVKNEPGLVKIAGMTSATFQLTSSQSKTVQNLNKLLTDSSYAVSGVKYTGLKTGTSDAAGYCVASSATYKGRKLVTVVLNATGDTTSRFSATQTLYQWIVDQGYTPQKLQLASSARTVSVKGGLPVKLKVSAPKLAVWTKGSTPKTYSATVNLSSKVAKNGKVVAPVKKGATLGTVTVKVKGIKFLDGTHKLTTKLVAKQAAHKANFLRVWWAKIAG